MHLNTDFIEKLRNSGLRPTKQRLKICDVLFNTNKTFHFTINDLSKIISEKGRAAAPIFLMKKMKKMIDTNEEMIIVDK